MGSSKFLLLVLLSVIGLQQIIGLPIDEDLTPYSSETDKLKLLQRITRQYGYGGGYNPYGGYGGGLGGGLGLSSSGAQASAGSSSFNSGLGGFPGYGGGLGASNSFANANSFSSGVGVGRK